MKLIAAEIYPKREHLRRMTGRSPGVYHPLYFPVLFLFSAVVRSLKFSEFFKKIWLPLRPRGVTWIGRKALHFSEACSTRRQKYFFIRQARQSAIYKHGMDRRSYLAAQGARGFADGANAIETPAPIGATVRGRPVHSNGKENDSDHHGAALRAQRIWFAIERRGSGSPG